MELTIKTIAGNRTVEVHPHTTVAQLKVVLQHDAAASKLVLKGKVLEESTVLKDVCQDSCSVVLLPIRTATPRPIRSTAPAPTSTQIDAAIREEVQRSPNPPGLDDASQRQRVQQAQRAQQQEELQALEDALAEGDLGALRAYLDQLQQVLRDGGQANDSQRRVLPGVLQSLLGAGLLGDGNVSDALARAALERGDGEELGEEFDMEEEEYTDDDYSGTEEEEEEWVDDEAEEEEEEDEDEEAESEEEGSDADAAGTETSEDRAAAAPLPPLAVPEVSATNLANLQDMGFQEPLCRNALLLHRNHLSRALEWIIEHAEDPAAAEPLSEARLAGIYGRRSDTSGSSSSARRRGPAVDPSRLAQLVDMGFPAPQAEEALRTFNNSVEAACLQLINMGTTAVAPSQPSSEQQQQQQQHQGDSMTDGSDAGGGGSSASAEQEQGAESRPHCRASASGGGEDDDVPSLADDDGASTDSGWECWELRPEARETSLQDVAAAGGTAAPVTPPTSQQPRMGEPSVQGTGPQLQGDLPSPAQQQQQQHVQPAEAAPSAMGAAGPNCAFAPEASTALHVASVGRAGGGEEGELEGVRSSSRLVLNGAKPSGQQGCQNIACGAEATAGAAAKGSKEERGGAD